MKKLLLMPIVSILFISCNMGLNGEGAATSKKEFPLTDYQSIEANCNCDITLIPSNNPKVVVESHQNLIDNLEINVNGNNLKIKEKSKVDQFDLYHVVVYSPVSLNEIELNKQSRMKISGTLKADRFKIEAKDQSFLDQAYVDIQDFEIELSDQAHLTITGTAINLDVDSSDQANGNFADLQTVDIKFKAEDNSNMSLYAMKNLSGEAQNNAQVSYKGDPNKNTTEKDRAFINKN